MRAIGATHSLSNISDSFKRTSSVDRSHTKRSHDDSSQRVKKDRVREGHRTKAHSENRRSTSARSEKPLAEEALTKKVVADASRPKKARVVKIPVEKFPVDKAPVEKDPVDKAPVDKAPPSKAPAETSKPKSHVKDELVLSRSARDDSAEPVERRAVKEDDQLGKLAKSRRTQRATGLRQTRVLAEARGIGLERRAAADKSFQDLASALRDKIRSDKPNSEEPSDKKVVSEVVVAKEDKEALTEDVVVQSDDVEGGGLALPPLEPSSPESLPPTSKDESESSNEPHRESSFDFIAELKRRLAHAGLPGTKLDLLA